MEGWKNGNISPDSFVFYLLSNPMDSAKHLEIELKFTLKNPNETLEFLRQHGEFIKESFQKDTYFLPPNQNFLAEKPTITKWLRVRASDKGNSITYKDWSIIDGVNQDCCSEYEIHIDSVESAMKLFGVLDIQPIVIVNKKRKLFTYQGVEIAVDEVDELGRFIEFEAKGEFASIENARDHLYTIADDMGAQLDAQDQKGYPYVLLERQGLI
ncbi:MAG: class IV adenylate cyclase [candidate division SR1 bacterium]|nr:class IV adenylate cyclase [candidate division SR1 bacterium]